MDAKASPSPSPAAATAWALPAGVLAWCVTYWAALGQQFETSVTPTLLARALPQVAFWATVVLLVRAAAAATTARDRRGWSWMAFGQLTSACVTARKPIEQYLFGQSVSPAWLGVFALVQVPCIVLGAMLLAGPSTLDAATRRAQPRDVALMLTAAVALFLMFGTWPSFEEPAPRSLYQTVAVLAAPLGWLIAIAGVHTALRRIAIAPSRRYALTLLLVVLVGRFTVDTVLAATDETGSLVGHEIPLAVWGAALGLHVLVPWVELHPHRRVPAWLEAGLSTYATTLLATLIVGVAMFAVQQEPYAAARTMPMAIGVVLIMSLMILRQGQYEHRTQRMLELERRRQREAQQLEAVERAATSTAHDFSNLLMLVDVNASMLRSVPMPSDAHQLVTEIGEATARGAALSRQLMRIGTSGAPDPVLVPLDARLQDVAPLLRRMLQPGIELMLELQAPQAAVRATNIQLEQLVMNLLWNARDAMPNGGTIRLATTAAPGTVTLTVRDTGIGMSDEVQSRVFDRFFTTKEHEPGHGVGLATVQDIVTDLGGSVRVESLLGAGSTFAITFPCSTTGAAVLDADTADLQLDNLVASAPPGTSTTSSSRTTAPQA